MNKKFKYILHLATGVIFLTPAMVAIACGPKTSKEQQGPLFASNYKGDKSILRYYVSSPSGNNSYAKTPSQFLNTSGKYISYGYSFSSEINSLNVGLVQEHHKGYPKYDFHGKMISGSKVKAFYTLELAKSITLVTPKGTFVYDQDDSGDNPSKKSINNPSFNENLNIATDIRFKIREDAKYIDTKGQVKGTVSIKDFWNGAKRIALLTSKKLRFENGGDETQDQNASQSFGFQFQSQDKNDPSNEYQNEMNLYSVENSSWTTFDDSKMSDLIDTHANEIHFKMAKPSFLTQDFFKDVFARSTMFSPYRDERLMQTSSNDVEKYRVYEGAFDKLEFTGRYYLSKNEQKTVEFKRNTHFYDRDFVSSKEVPKTVFYEFATQSDDYKRALLSKFKIGDIVGNGPLGISVQGLLKSQKDEINKNEKNYYFGYIKGSSPLQIIPYQNYAQQQVLGINMFNKSISRLSYTGNDNYYKVIAGNSFDALKNNQTTLDMASVGRGASFRSAITAAINWPAVIRQLTKGDSLQFYGSLMPPELNVIASDGTFSPIDENIFNDVEVVYKDQKAKVTVAEWRNELVKESDKKEKLKSPHFQDIKNIVKSILDDAGIASGQKVQWEISFQAATGLYLKDENNKEIMDNFLDIIKQLDPRLEPVPLMKMETGKASPGPYRETFKSLTTDDIDWGKTVLPRLMKSGSRGGISAGKIDKSLPANVILDNANDLETGWLAWLSIFDDPSLSQKTQDFVQMYSKDVKPITNIINDKLEQYVRDTSDDLKNKLLSSQKINMLDSLKNFNMADLHKSHQANMAAYDYAGFENFNSWSSAYENAINKATKTDDDEKIIHDYNLLSSAFNLAMKKTAYYANIDLKKLTKSELIKGLHIFDLLQGGPTNPAIASIGNRTKLAANIDKDYITNMNIRDGGYRFLSEIKIKG